MTRGWLAVGVAALVLAALPVSGGAANACSRPAVIASFSGVGHPPGAVVRARPGDPDPTVDRVAADCRRRARVRAAAAAVLGAAVTTVYLRGRRPGQDGDGRAGFEADTRS